MSTGGLRGGIENAEPALIADILPPESSGSILAAIRQLVDRLLGGERKGQIERRAQRARRLEIARPSAPRG